MSDKPYEKECMFCNKTITMSKETGKWLPYNNDGSAHDCRDRDRPKQENHKEITLEEVRKKLESIGISLDLEKLMNQK
jgi:hypothetical protein